MAYQQFLLKYRLQSRYLRRAQSSSGHPSPSFHLCLPLILSFSS